MITKIDIMDQGTDAASMLRGEDVPLRLGYVGVKMRSQQDIVNKKPAAWTLMGKGPIDVTYECDRYILYNL